MISISDAELLLRLTLAAVLGGVIGYERQSRRKSAGLRTNMLVCLGSCLIMIISQEIYAAVEGKTNADPARLAAQVVSGIGFLGAGAIMKEGLTVTGLTTAACLWVVAGVGIAVGGGYYTGALFTSALVFVTLGTLSRLDEWLMHERYMSISIHTTDLPRRLAPIHSCLEFLHLEVHGIKVTPMDNSAANSTKEQIFRIDVEVYNRQGIKRTAVVDAFQKLDGILRVDIA